MNMDWEAYLVIGFMIGLWTYHGIYFVVMKTYARKQIMNEFYEIADEMGYTLVEKDPEMGR